MKGQCPKRSKADLEESGSQGERVKKGHEWFVKRKAYVPTPHNECIHYFWQTHANKRKWKRMLSKVSLMTLEASLLTCGTADKVETAEEGGFQLESFLNVLI